MQETSIVLRMFISISVVPHSSISFYFFSKIYSGIDSA